VAASASATGAATARAVMTPAIDTARLLIRLIRLWVHIGSSWEGPSVVGVKGRIDNHGPKGEWTGRGWQPQIPRCSHAQAWRETVVSPMPNRPVATGRSAQPCPDARGQPGRLSRGSGLPRRRLAP
jgi:hypothetical protein